MRYFITLGLKTTLIYLPGTRYEDFLAAGDLENVAVSPKNGTWKKVNAQGCTIIVLQSDTACMGSIVTELCGTAREY